MHKLVNWKDRRVERPRTYTEVMNSDGSRTDTPAPGEIQEAGTQMSATNFNQMDYGILDAHIAAAMMLIRQQQNEWRTDALETAKYYEANVLKDMAELRAVVDSAEALIPEAYLPYPTYGEMLFSLR